MDENKISNRDSAFAFSFAAFALFAFKLRTAPTIIEPETQL
jgi:hypothetical protein